MDAQRTAELIASELTLGMGQVARTIELFDQGNTLPFIARYRKEVTGNLDEEQLRDISERMEYLRRLADRRETVLDSIRDQDKLTEELRQRILSVRTLQELEDIYLPYRPKRTTRATKARERGLEPLAQALLHSPSSERTAEELAADYLDHKDVQTLQDALAGARDIIAEMVAENADVRRLVREAFQAQGVLTSQVSDAAADQEKKFQDYYDFRQSVASLEPHRILALERAEEQGVVQIGISLNDATLLAQLVQRLLRSVDTIYRDQIRLAVEDGYQRLLRPSLERQTRTNCREKAERHAIEVFGRNLRSLLLQRPLKQQRVLGIDPAYRTGCKVAVIDETGRLLEYTTLYPHAPRKEWAAAKRALADLLARRAVPVIAIGNGTASRETEQLVSEVLSEGAEASYAMVSEAGASVYSASPLARKELPDLDVAMRGAVSIARRLQDPLAELVKIEPKSIGVGLYQHDVDQKALDAKLSAVVESVVNFVGVDLNTASPALLEHVSGLNGRVARAIVAHRDENGPFRERSELRRVRGIGPKRYQQAAGFLKIPVGANRLDNTFIHPESYPACRNLFRLLELGEDRSDWDSISERWSLLRAQGLELEDVARELDVGVPTLRDILSNLQRPGRDPRDELPPPLLRADVLTIDDLHEGMTLQGTVRNVVDFGAFVDIGVKKDGLIHISELADRYVSDPLQVVSVGDVVRVTILAVDRDRQRISLRREA